MSADGTRRVALITGGSRGVGAATAVALAKQGFDVAITFRNKSSRAKTVVAEIEGYGTRAISLGGDITQESDLNDQFAELMQWTTRLDVLVLNASGGLERDLVAADPDYPIRINRDAQVACVQKAAPLMRNGGTIVFVTSHWAHLHGEVEQLPAYEPVAASKHAGEHALRAMSEQLAARGIRLLVVTGDLIEGTITAKLLERSAPGLAASRQDHGGRVATTKELGEAIAAATLDPALSTGDTVVVGGSLASLPRIAPNRLGTRS